MTAWEVAEKQGSALLLSITCFACSLNILLHVVVLGLSLEVTKLTVTQGLAGVENEELLTVPIVSNLQTKQHVLSVILTVQTTANLSAMV